MTIALLFLVLALVCFLIATVNSPAIPINLTALGLAFLCIHWLVGKS